MVHFGHNKGPQIKQHLVERSKSDTGPNLKEIVIFPLFFDYALTFLHSGEIDVGSHCDLRITLIA